MQGVTTLQSGHIINGLHERMLLESSAAKPKHLDTCTAYAAHAMWLLTFDCYVRRVQQFVMETFLVQ